LSSAPSNSYQCLMKFNGKLISTVVMVTSSGKYALGSLASL